MTERPVAQICNSEWYEPTFAIRRAIGSQDSPQSTSIAHGSELFTPVSNGFSVKIIDRYIMTEFLKVFGICVMGFVLVLLLVEITDKIKYYFEYNPPGWLMFKYFLVKIPGYMFYAIPMGILMGGMMSLLMMARHSEIIAMQANGIDALDVARPVLLVGMAASVIMLLADETVIPWSNRYSEYIQNVEIAGKPDTALFKSDEIWMRSPDSIIHVGKFDKSTFTLEQLTIVTWDRELCLFQAYFRGQSQMAKRSLGAVRD